jgi:PAS domain S-box-containing protein
VTAGTTTDPRDAEIEHLRTELAAAKAALGHALARGRGEDHVSRYDDVNARAAIDGIPGFVAILAPDGNVEVVNRQIVKYSGRTPEELRDWNAIGIVHDDDALRNAALFLEAIVHGMPYDHEIRLRRHDGVFRWFSNRGVPITDDNGNVLRWYVLLTDIDDRKCAEERLAESRRELKLAIDATPALIWSATPDGHTDSVNQHFVDYVGSTYEELENKGWRIAIHPDDHPTLDAVWDNLRATGKPGQAEARLRRYDGTYRWFLLRAHPLRDESGNVVRWYGVNTDIEDRKRAEERLAASERSLQQTVDTIPTFVVCNDAEGLHEFANRPWHDYTGLTPEAARGTGWEQALHPDDRGRLLAAWRKMVRSGEGGDVEGRMRHHDGEYRWFLFRSKPLRDDGGKAVRWYSTNIDIERRWRAEQALAESELRLRQTIETIPTIVFSNDAEGANEHISGSWYDYTGLSPEKSVGTGWMRALHADDRPRMTQALLEMRRTGEGSEIEARVRRHDGAYRWFLFISASLRDPARRVVRWYGTVTDIDDRKVAEAELQRAYRDLNEAQRLSSTGSFTNDYFGRTHLWSDELYRIFGFERTDALVDRDLILDRLHPDDRDWVAGAFSDAAHTGKDIDARFRILLPGGEVRHLHLIGHVTGWQEAHPVIIGAVQDITEAKRAEIALDRARAELEYAARVMSLGVLTASIAHEVNQPLSGIITNANTAQRMLSSDPPNLDGARETLRRTIRDGYRASEVIARLRALFGKKDFAAGAVDLNDAAREVVAMTQDEMRRRRVVVALDFAEALPQAAGDRVQLQQVVLNLLMNASDALREVHERRREISLRTVREDDAVCVSVRDNGPGLAPDTLQRIFEPFFTTKESGMGIGLSVSRSIIERHQGRLWAMPNDGPGVTFAFSIPIEAPPR